MQEHDNGIDFYKLAEQKIPKAWYERDFLLAISPLAVVGGFSLWGYYIQEVLSQGNYPLLIIPHIVSGLFCHISDKIDIDSTVQSFEASERAKLRGVEHDFYEENPLLSDAKSATEFLNHPNLHAGTIAQQIISILIPGMGIPISVLKVIQAASNFRNAERLNLAADIAQEKNS